MSFNFNTKTETINNTETASKTETKTDKKEPIVSNDTKSTEPVMHDIDINTGTKVPSGIMAAAFAAASKTINPINPSPEEYMRDDVPEHRTTKVEDREYMDQLFDQMEQDLDDLRVMLKHHKSEYEGMIDFSIIWKAIENDILAADQLPADIESVAQHQGRLDSWLVLLDAHVEIVPEEKPKVDHDPGRVDGISEVVQPANPQDLPDLDEDDEVTEEITEVADEHHRPRSDWKQTLLCVFGVLGFRVEGLTPSEYCDEGQKLLSRYYWDVIRVSRPREGILNWNFPPEFYTENKGACSSFIRDVIHALNKSKIFKGRITPAGEGQSYVQITKR